MSQPIFPKGTKVVKGKVVQRLQGSSRVKEQKTNLRKGAEDEVIRGAGGDAGMRAHYTGTDDPDFLKAVVRLIQEGRTGPRLAPGQQSKPKTSTKMIRDMEEGSYSPRGKLGDPRQQRELPKNRPGRLNSKMSTQMANQEVEGYEGVDQASARDIELNFRQGNPAMEGRESGFLSKIQEAMDGKPLPAPLIEQLRGLDPAKLKEILTLINKSKRPSGQKGTNEQSKLNAYMNRHPEDIDWNLEVEHQVPY